VAVGPNGLGGAVNIITRRGGTGPLARVWGETSVPFSREVRLEHSLDLGRVAWTVSGGHFEQSAWPLSAAFVPTDYEAGPLRANSDKTLNHAALAATVRLSAKHELTATAWIFDGNRGMPPSTNDDRPRYWRFTVWRALNAQLAHRLEVSETASVDTMVWVRQFDNLLDSYDSALYQSQLTPRAFLSWYHDPVVGLRSRGRLRVEAPWGPVHLRLWAGGQWEGHTSTTTQQTAPENYQRLTGTLVPEAETTFGRRVMVQLALQGDLEVPLQMPSVKVGTALGPRATAQWRPINGLSLSVSGARTTRFAGLKERFSSGLGVREPNPALGPEAAWTATAEVRWSTVEPLELMLLGSHSAVDGLITTVNLASGLTQLQNVAHAQLSSVEGKVAWRPHSSLRLEVGVQGLRAVQLTDAEPQPLDYRAPVQGVAQVSWTPLPQLRVWAGVKASGARAFLNPDTRKQDALPGFADLSLRLEGRPIPTVAAWLRATNLFDSAIDSQYGFPRPGRQLCVGLSVDIDSPTRGEAP
jgi:iron complex outermembrane receptor protein